MTLEEKVARAEADTFGLGDGHDGPKSASANEIINSYAPLTTDAGAGAMQLSIGAVIGNPSGFAGGDLVLLWRATGVPSADGPSGDQGRKNLSTLGDGNVGKYEFARVASVAGATVRLTNPLVGTWLKDVTQIVKVPEYTTVEVPANASFVAQAWTAVGTGYAGGMVTFLANGTFSLAGKLDADGKGFRGGAGVQRLALALVCNGNDGTPPNGFGSKGEGVVHLEYGPDKGGIGNRSIGAGGGNCIEAGGGGGGNYGIGGTGGRLLSGGATVSGTGGMGGGALDYSLLERITMGGGGGAGENKDGSGAPGGPGGGAIFVRVQTLSGNGKFSAVGLKAVNVGVGGQQTVTDAAGGGGAGGSVLVRVAGGAECSGLGARGGAGGDTNVAGLDVFGPGGGGGGGRVLIQAGTLSPQCTADTAPGQGGNNGGGGSGGGGNGAVEPPPNGAFCTGPFRTGPAPACQVQVKPVCDRDGSCKACNGDFNSGQSESCQVFGSPVCFSASFADGPSIGSCDKCKRDDHCAGAGHAGPICHLPQGFCGKGCTTDTDCNQPAEWCSKNTGGSTQGVCVPKVPNGDPLPKSDPDIQGECTPSHGQRVCVSRVCEADDDKCGKHNGTACGGSDGGASTDASAGDGGTAPVGSEECRSNICFPADHLCGKPNGEPCNGHGECRSDICKDGLCRACATDDNCPGSQICDPQQFQCVDGCHPDADGGKGTCASGQTCVVTDGGAVGKCQPAGDGGLDGGSTTPADTAGIIEGGGCACNSTTGAASSPLVLAASLCSLWLARRRRRNGRN